jgi:Ni,Fe-hydrogenase I cytochrome b subunit
MADHHLPEHQQGSMDIRAQEKTFEGFVRMTVWVVCIVICVLIFMGLVNA